MSELLPCPFCGGKAVATSLGFITCDTKLCCDAIMLPIYWNTRAMPRKLPDEHPVFAFLLGEGQLNGYGFGDKNENERGTFWWRKHLREALTHLGVTNDA